MKFNLITPSRIHMSLIDLNGTIGRIDGGFGMTIEKPNFKIFFSNETQKDFSYKGPIYYKELVEEIKNNLEKRYEINLSNISIKIVEIIPEHIGLGSKTQFSLAIARGLLNFTDIDHDIMEITEIINRGGTSGIGYMAFDIGGFILDLGHSFGKTREKTSFLPSSASKCPPALPFIQRNLPNNWKILLIQLDIEAGANNTEEVNIFQKNCPIPLQDVQEISHLILLKLIPSLISNDLKTMGESIHSISNLGFKKIEISLQNPLIPLLIQKIYKNFKIPVGMSSFGPTIYTISDSKVVLKKIEKFVKKTFSKIENSPNCFFTHTRINNEGHKIEYL